MGGVYGDVEANSNLRSHGRRKVLAQQRKVFGTGEVEAGGPRIEAGVSADDEVAGLFIDVLSLVLFDFRVEWQLLIPEMLISWSWIELDET